jgi:hypothetical protein
MDLLVNATVLGVIVRGIDLPHPRELGINVERSGGYLELTRMIQKDSSNVNLNEADGIQVDHKLND